MTLRKRPKLDSKFTQKDEEVQEENIPELLALSKKQPGGASYLKYKVVEKKGDKMLVPVRYSIRNQPAASKRQNLDTTFHTKEAMKAAYKPSQMENLFSMSATSQQTAMLMRSKIAPKLQPGDFDRITRSQGHFSLVRLNQQGKERFQGAEQVAVATRSLGNYGPQKQAQMVKDLLSRLKTEAKTRGQR